MGRLVSESTQGYFPDRGHRQTVNYIAIFLTIGTVFTMIPAASHWRFVGEPVWAQAVLLVTLVQLAYIGWMISMKDWSSVLMVMVIYVAASAMYGAVLAVAMFTPLGTPMRFDLEPVRDYAVAWSASMLLINLLSAFLTGRVGFRWKRAYHLAWAGR